MFFLKRKSNATKSNDQVEPVPNETPVPETETTTEPASLETNPYSVNLFGKFRNQQINPGPETSYENEAWAPETELIGLFRKHRAIVEEHLSSSSGPQ